jgi:3-oxoacyl-[acyl-carrier protein] reductase
VDLGVAGRNFVLVGGTTGMGFAAAEQLAADGANVALLARDGDHARDRAARLVADHGVRGIGIAVDAAVAGNGMDRAIEQAAADLGPL